MSIRLLFPLLAGLLLLATSAAPGRAAPERKVLYFTKSSGFEHSVVRRHAGRPSWSEQVLAELGPKLGIAFTFSKDGSLFTPDYLAQFDAFVFFTSGDLLGAGRDGQPPMTAAGKAAFLEAIRGGKGFIGLHAAADTFHTGETVDTNTAGARTWRYRHDGERADPYIRMLGAEFIVHGQQQPAYLRIVDPSFPGQQDLGPKLDLVEEWYSLTDFSADLHVIHVLETDTMRDPEADPAAAPTPQYAHYFRPEYPVTWARRHGTGRVFYTALGHREDVWTNPVFQQMLAGALAWVTGTVDADVTPNIREVTPRAWELPPVAPISGGPARVRPAPARPPVSSP